MTKAEINHFRRCLLDLRKRVGGDLTELEEETLKPVGGESSGGLSDMPVHPADLGTEEFEEELSLTLVKNEEELLAEIDEALDRTEDGTYGRCENCHKEIPRERLEALPYARYCIRCTRILQGQATS